VPPPDDDVTVEDEDEFEVDDEDDETETDELDDALADEEEVTEPGLPGVPEMVTDPGLPAFPDDELPRENEACLIVFNTPSQQRIEAACPDENPETERRGPSRHAR
jgi:hypothetical protein